MLKVHQETVKTVIIMFLFHFLRLYATKLERPTIRPNLYKQSCVFWVLFMYKNERKQLKIPEMGGSAGPGGVWTALGPL